MDLSRRRVLRSGVAAAIVGLAGCTSGDETGGTTEPAPDPTTETAEPTITESTTTDDTTPTETQTETEACGSPEAVSGTITEDTTWDCPQYRMTGSVTVRNGATLTIEPGVRVVAEAETRLRAGSSGSIVAEGTQDSRVVFEGAAQRAGFWQGIEITGDSGACSFAYADVRSGGANDWANLYLQNGADVSLDDCVVESSSSYGLLAEANTTLRTFGSNTFRNNEQASLWVQPAHLQSLDTATEYGNEDDVGDARIEVANRAITTDTTVQSIGAFYVFPEGAQVRAALTIEPGTSCLFGDGARLVVEQDGSLFTPTDGDSLSAFMGDTRTSGFWQGIEFVSDDPDNVLDQVIVQDAGGDDWAPVYLQSGASVTLREVIFANAPTDGLYVEKGASLRGFESNTFRDSLAGAMTIPLDQLDQVDTQSTFELDTWPAAITIHEGTVTDAATWNVPQAAVRFATNGVVRAPVTMEAGFSCEFEAHHRLTVEEGGSLSAVGTRDDRIFISGAYDGGSRVRWQGIEFASQSFDNRLENTVVTLGGADDWANVYLQSGSSVSIVDCALQSSETYALTAESDTQLNEWSNNTLLGNAEGSMRIPAALLGSIDPETALGSADDKEPIHVHSGPVTTEATWANFDAPVHFSTSVSLQAPVSIAAGPTFTFAEDTRLSVEEGGSLRAVGDQDGQISFLPEDIGPRGFWEGIEFVSNDSHNELKNVLINGGGANGWANVYVQEGGRVTLRNSTLVASGTYGLAAEADTTLPEFANNFFGLNDGGDMRLPASGLGQLDSVSTYADDQDTAGRIDVFAAPVTEATTWYSTPFTVHFTEGVSIEARVSIRQGTTYTFAQGTRLSVTGDGSLTVLGDPDYPVTFEGTSDVAGFWHGIEFATLSDDNHLQHCAIANGGADGWANVYVQSTGMATVENCTLRDSATFGIIAEDGGQLSQQNNTFSGNVSGDVSV